MRFYVLRILSTSRPNLHPEAENKLIADYKDVTGDLKQDISLTDDPQLAKRFKTPTDAMSWWFRRSVREPFRSDGHPNRPLTAYNVQVDKVDTKAPEPPEEEVSIYKAS